MHIYDLLNKKKHGIALSKSEITYLIDNFTQGQIPDYQMSAFLMAVWFNGMSKEELFDFTQAMSHSGDNLHLPFAPIPVVDKHSTGGVGDKTTLVVIPIVAACGIYSVKMSGRGLGHTGGTIDKLEAIPNFQTSLSKEQFLQNVRKIGAAITGQTGNLAPADKKIYALRDVTATVDSIPLIASSIMSKKLAAGSDCILLDVKVGSGAFMKTLKDAVELASTMADIGTKACKKTAALITNMDSPLGYAIGNSLEVQEAIATLHGHGPADFRELCMQLAAYMLYLADKGSLQGCRALAEEAMYNKKALQKFIDIVAAQGGDTSYIEDPSKFPRAPYIGQIFAPESGYIAKLDAEQCGRTSMLLGAGRNTKEDKIDSTAGLILNKKYGNYVRKGELLATLYTSDKTLLPAATKTFLEACAFSALPPPEEPLVFAYVNADKVVMFHD